MQARLIMIIAGGLLALPNFASAQQVRIWFTVGDKVLTTDEWSGVPTIGVQFIVVCSDEKAPDGSPLRRKFSSGDAYCNTSKVTPDGWDQSEWIGGKQVPLHRFLERSGCDPESVRFGLMIPRDIWEPLEQEASQWRCED